MKIFVFLVLVVLLVAGYFFFTQKGPYKGDWESDQGYISMISISKDSFPCEGKVIIGRGYALRSTVILTLENGQLIGTQGDAKILVASFSDGQLSGTYKSGVMIDGSKEFTFSGLKRK